MAQLKALCNVTNGSQVVVFPGQDVSAQVKTNRIFMVEGEHVPYWLAGDAVYNGTDTLGTLTGVYQGNTAAGITGIVVTGVTMPHNIPTIDQGDVGTAAVFTAAMYKVEQIFNELSGLLGTNGAVIASTDNLPEGNANRYFSPSRVRSATLTGMDMNTVAPVTQADNILIAMGKLVAQLAAHIAKGGTGANTHPLAAPNGDAGFMSGEDKAKLDGIPAGGAAGAALTVGPTPPSNPVQGQEWIDTNTGIRWTWHNDGTSAQWVDFSS